MGIAVEVLGYTSEFVDEESAQEVEAIFGFNHPRFSQSNLQDRLQRLVLRLRVSPSSVGRATTRARAAWTV